MQNPLQYGLGEFTIGWFLLSIVIGGIFGAFLRYLFDIRLAEDFRRRRSFEEKIRQYSYPLLAAASDVELRIETILSKGIRKGWLTSDVVRTVNEKKGFLENPAEGIGYFYLSTLYAFARYFAWLEIMRRETGYLEFPTNERKSQHLYHILHRVNNAFRCTDLWDIDDQSNAKDFTKLHRHIQSAIGELMLIERNDELICMSFHEFVDYYFQPDNHKFRFWLCNLGKYFEGLSNLNVDDVEQIIKTGEYRIFRLVAIQYWFYQLVRYLDPKFEKVQDRSPEHEKTILNRLPASYRLKVVELPAD